ncbi:hypothetical protein [Paenibacillus sp. PK3_47]|uniref:hypothetical protein n=1 Tax=Paenibacillus sp. PK3_47 TaxID=2072642 RepID=UPI00201D3968|nr:hypothetical protein [Paenibacillus sp. PK3_47]
MEQLLGAAAAASFFSFAELFQAGTDCTDVGNSGRATQPPATRNRNPQAANRKPQTANRKPQTANRKPQTANRKPQTANRNRNRNVTVTADRNRKP